MKTQIGGIRDTLDQRVAQFEQTPLTQSVLINSVPKGGTHLLRNILRMFVPVEQHYDREFVQMPILREHGRSLMSDPPYLVCGHLIFTPETAFLMHKARHILLVRDPYDWVLARARFFLSDEFQQAELEILKTGFVSVPDLLNLMIVGTLSKFPSLLDMYTLNAVAWFGTDMHLVRYEDAVAAVKDLSTSRSEAFFMALFAAAGIDPPANWRERVEIGADRRQSRTARENLNLPKGMVIPDVLPEPQRRLVDFLAPGLRAFLGYA
ncbi:MAG TPA: hypothetical protein VFN88_02755 [Caulobacteraceae bacterium]|nr:hypothetical protein [Caulobacteraceae bacterium]